MKTDSQTKTLKLLKNPADFSVSEGAILWDGGKPRDLLQSPPKSSDVRPSFLSSLGQKEPSCPIATTDACAQTRANTHPRSSLRASDYLSIHARTILLQSHFVFLERGGGVGKKESRAAGSPSLWFLSLKGGSASKLGAGQRSRWPDGKAREKGVSGA